MRPRSLILLQTALYLIAAEPTKDMKLECRELQMEFERLQKLRELVQQKLDKNQQLLQKIEQEKQAIEKLKQELEKEQKEILSDHYQKLAKDFENMDPEYAGEKFSKMEDPKVAAFILYNMNPRKAGDALNYVDPKMVNKITKILTKLKKRNEQ